MSGAISAKYQARYLRIAERLRAAIAAGEFDVGARLPSQRELAARFDTTLMTLRQSLMLLEAEGLVASEHGVGTFVIDPTSAADTLQLLSFGDAPHTAAPVETTLLNNGRYAVEDEAARLFRLPPATPLPVLERVRTHQGVPIVFQRSFLVPRLVHILDSYRSQQPLYTQIRAATGETVVLGREFLVPTTLNADQASRLGQEPSAAAFLSRRASFNRAGQLIVFDVALLRGDAFVVAIQHLGRQTVGQLRMVPSHTELLARLLCDDEPTQA